MLFIWGIKYQAFYPYHNHIGSCLPAYSRWNRSSATPITSPHWWLLKKSLHQLPQNQWIGLRENLQESPIFHGKIYGFRCRFSLKPIHWHGDLIDTSECKWCFTWHITWLTCSLQYIYIYTFIIGDCHDPWTGNPHRSTRCVGLQCYGESLEGAGEFPNSDALRKLGEW